MFYSLGSGSASLMLLDLFGCLALGASPNDEGHVTTFQNLYCLRCGSHICARDTRRQQLRFRDYPQQRQAETQTCV
jgi:hypothetical protein